VIGSFIWHLKGKDHLVELHWVEGGPAWVTDESGLELYLNVAFPKKTVHPESPGYPYWWQAIEELGQKNVTIIKVPPRQSEPPMGAKF
jgi:hypothetical protein